MRGRVGGLVLQPKRDCVDSRQGMERVDRACGAGNGRRAVAVSDAVAGDGKLAARVVADEIILERRRVAATRSPDFCALLRAFFASVLDRYERVPYGAGKGCELPNFKGSSLGRVPLVSADFWTGDHLSERPRSVDAFGGTRARGLLKRM